MGLDDNCDGSSIITLFAVGKKEKRKISLFNKSELNIINYNSINNKQMKIKFQFYTFWNYTDIYQL